MVLARGFESPSLSSSCLSLSPVRLTETTSKMFLTRLCSVALAASTLFATRVYAQCDTISVRREWRQFSTDEKTEWISAVKVSLFSSSVVKGACSVSHRNLSA